MHTAATLTLEEITSDAVLAQAYTWLCERRKDYPAAADCWSFRRHWPDEKVRLRAELLAGTYQFSLLSRVTLWVGGVSQVQEDEVMNSAIISSINTKFSLLGSIVLTLFSPLAAPARRPNRSYSR